MGRAHACLQCGVVEEDGLPGTRQTARTACAAEHGLDVDGSAGSYSGPRQTAGTACAEEHGVNPDGSAAAAAAVRRTSERSRNEVYNICQGDTQYVVLYFAMADQPHS